MNNCEIVFTCKDLDENIGFFTRDLGFHLHSIFPADDPRAAVVKGGGLRIRLERGALDSGGRIRVMTEGSETEKILTAPNGVRIEFASSETTSPVLAKGLVVNKYSDDGWVQGRAGMYYRDLVPGRLGGALIASHIRIPDGGPVPDYVHFHEIRFQMIFCCKGWARLVYEDQGEPFLLGAGDCVLQPPMIRHRVLECSDNLEVVEISSPAEHITYAEHEITLPTLVFRPERDFGGQRFVRHIASQAAWEKAGPEGFDRRDTGIGIATGGLARSNVIRSVSGDSIAGATLDGEIRFIYVLSGGFVLNSLDGKPQSVSPGDSVCISGAVEFAFEECSPGLEFLETAIHL